MRRTARTSIAGITAFTATVALATGSGAAGAAPQGRGCVPIWSQVEVSYVDYREPNLFLEIAEVEPPIPNSVTALSATDVRLAGNYGGWNPYLQRWTGRVVDSAERQLPTPPWFHNAGSDLFLTNQRAQSFSSPEDGWLLTSHAGFETHGGQNVAVPYRWHDGRWNLVSTAAPPSPLTHETNPADVVSVSSDDAWIVGARTIADPNTPRGHPDGVHIEHWDGTRWSIVDNPLATERDAILISVTALAADNVWAVGQQLDDTGMGVPLVMNWDGTEWRTVEAPVASAPATLRGISGTGPDDLWAVGGQTNPETGVAVPLAMHWDGTEWRTVEVADVGNARLHAVYAAAPDDVWAVGQFPFGADAYFLHWDGRSWSRVRPPGAASGVELRDLYLDIHGSGPDNVWAVGVHNNDSTVTGWKPIVARLSCGRPR